MADIFETRCISEHFCGSHNLVRIACIGDSMMWGQGSARHQALPAQLERQMNAACLDDLVWVDNFGQTSGNLWHAWPRMKRRAEAQAFDAIIFSVCENDARIFESATVRYDDDFVATWTSHFAAARDLFADVAAFSQYHDTVIVIVYYTFRERDRPVIEALAPMMDDLRLPFVDLLKFYKEETGISPMTFRASEFDGHPSALGHELAGRRVTRELLDRLPLSGRFGKDPAQVLEDAMLDLTDQRVPVDAALDWARESIAAKARAARRRQRADLIKACGEMSEPLAERQRQWRLVRNVEAIIRAERLPIAYWEVWLPNLYAQVRQLEEFIFLFEKAANPVALEWLGALFPEDGYFHSERVSFFTGNARDQIETIRAALARLTALNPDRFQCPGGWLLPLGPRSRLRDSLDLGVLTPEFGLLQVNMASYSAALSALDALADRFEPDMEQAAVRRVWAIVFSYLHGFVTYLEELERCLLETAGGSLDAESTLTCIEVTLEGGPDPELPDAACSLMVEGDYLVPERGRLREKHWAGVVKDRAVYRFEMPLMVLGTLRVGVAAHEPMRQRFLRGTTRLAQIKIYNISPKGGQAEVVPDGEAVVTWTDADCRLPLVEIPCLLLLR